MIKGELFFDPKNPVYSYHFPGDPVVPGSFIVEELKNAAIENNLEIKLPVVLKQFTFRKFLRPGLYNYEFEVSEKNIKCTITSDGVVYCTGRFVNEA